MNGYNNNHNGEHDVNRPSLGGIELQTMPPRNIPPSMRMSEEGFRSSLSIVDSDDEDE